MLRINKKKKKKILPLYLLEKFINRKFTLFKFQTTKKRKYELKLLMYFKYL